MGVEEAVSWRGLPGLSPSMESRESSSSSESESAATALPAHTKSPPTQFSYTAQR